MPIGFHISKSSRKWEEAITDDARVVSNYGIRGGFQIFTHGPRSPRANLTPDDVKIIKETTKRLGIGLVVHGAYTDKPWGAGASAAAIHNIADEMKTAAEIGATGVVVHLGAGAADDHVLLRFLENISSKIPREFVTLWLEINAAKSHSATFETPKKLRALFSRITNLNPGLKIGLCVDTAHLYSCGVSLDTASAAREFLDGLPDGVPIMFHLNDSASELGSGLDRHAALTHGNIWKLYHKTRPIRDSGLYEILKYADDRDCMVILEREPAGLVSDLKIISESGFFKLKTE